MKTVRMSVAILSAVSLLMGASGLAPAREAPLAIVLEANLANLSTTALSPGTTLFSGDRLYTEPNGTLRLRAHGTLLSLGGGGKIALQGMQSPENGVSVSLSEGTLAFSTALAAAIDVQVQGAKISAAKDGPSVSEVSVLGPRELLLSAQRGETELSYRDESATIQERQTVRVILDPEEEGDSGDVSKWPQRKSTHKRRAFLLIALGGGAGALLGEHSGSNPKHHRNPAESESEPD